MFVSTFKVINFLNAFAGLIDKVTTMALERDCKFVINLSGGPPPIEQENTDRSRPSTVETYCLKMGRANDAGKIEFRADSNVLGEFRDPNVLSAFICGDPAKLPSGHLRQTM